MWQRKLHQTGTLYRLSYSATAIEEKIEDEKSLAPWGIGDTNPQPLDHEACSLPLCYNRSSTNYYMSLKFDLGIFKLSANNPYTLSKEIYSLGNILGPNYYSAHVRQQLDLYEQNLSRKKERKRKKNRRNELMLNSEEIPEISKNAQKFLV